MKRLFGGTIGLLISISLTASYVIAAPVGTADSISTSDSVLHSNLFAPSSSSSSSSSSGEQCESNISTGVSQYSLITHIVSTSIEECDEESGTPTEREDYIELLEAAQDNLRFFRVYRMLLSSTVKEELISILTDVYELNGCDHEQAETIAKRCYRKLISNYRTVWFQHVVPIKESIDTLIEELENMSDEDFEVFRMAHSICSDFYKLLIP